MKRKVHSDDVLYPTYHYVDVKISILQQQHTRFVLSYNNGTVIIYRRRRCLV